MWLYRGSLPLGQYEAGRGRALLLALGMAVVFASSVTADPPMIAPTIKNVTEAGSGCPIGDGGMVHEMRNNTPVFQYESWTLTLNGSAITVDDNGTSTEGNNPGGQDSRVVRGSVAKFCKETISLGNVPAGVQLRISEVSVTGYAELDAQSFVGLRVTTRFNRVEAGRAHTTVNASQLVNGTFSVSLAPSPEVWSVCVDDSGTLPNISVRTTVSVNGTALASGVYSSGSLGDMAASADDSPKMDMNKTLRLHFVPEWRACVAASPAADSPPPASTEPASSSPPSPIAPPTPPVKDTPVKDPPVKDPPMRTMSMEP